MLSSDPPVQRLAVRTANGFPGITEISVQTPWLSTVAEVRQHVAEQVTPRFTVLYLPGRWQSGDLWAVDYPDNDVRISLARAGARIATVGYRFCSVPCYEQAISSATLPARVSLVDLIADIRLACEQVLGGVDVLAGYSFGGCVALLVCGEEFFRRRLRAVISLDGGFYPDERAVFPMRDAAVSPMWIENPLWDRRARMQLWSALNGTLHGSFFGRLSRDCIRLLLSETRWWPVTPLEELRAVACHHASAAISLCEALGTAEARILCVASTREDKYLARMSYVTSSSARAHLIALDQYSHLEICAGRLYQPGHVGEMVRSWLSNVVHIPIG